MATAAGLSSREAVLWLLQRGHQPEHLRPSLGPGAELLTACLEEVIALREGGQADLSLALVDWLQAEGLDSPWLQDNRARALVSLGRTAEAVEHWEQLQQEPEAAVAGLAAATLQQLLEQLLQGLHHHCDFHSWQPRHLPAPGETLNAALLHTALEEAIASREEGRAGLSLALMEEALHQGWGTPWVLDNRARALVNLDRRDEARLIWMEVSRCGEATAAALAQDALAHLEAEQRRQDLEAQAAGLIAAGQASEAQALLLAALMAQPDSPGLWVLLERSLDEPGVDGSGDLLQQELAAVERRIQAQELWLDQVETELQR